MLQKRKLVKIYCFDAKKNLGFVITKCFRVLGSKTHVQKLMLFFLHLHNHGNTKHKQTTSKEKHKKLNPWYPFVVSFHVFYLNLDDLDSGHIQGSSHDRFW